jgi:uncharacterized protein YggE
MKTATAAVLALTLALPLLAARPARAAEDPATLTLSAEGVSRQAPDMATLSLGVVTEAPTAGDALKQNAERMTKVMAALRNAGLAERDIQTSGLSISPQYDYVNGKPPALRGYQAANQVTATVRDLRRLGPILDSTVSVGANSAGQVARASTSYGSETCWGQPARSYPPSSPRSPAATAFWADSGASVERRTWGYARQAP